MPEPTLEIEAALAMLGRELETPAAPALSDRVASRLLAERRSAVPRPLSRRALWTPRTRLVVATLVVLAILAVAATARLVIGAVEIRVVPSESASETASPSPTAPPLDPSALGRPVALERLNAAAGFDVGLPTGRPPDATYVSASGDGAVVLAWSADDRSPALPGTPWGLVLLEIPGPSDELLVKTVSAFEDTDEVELDGDRAFWIHAPHELLVVTDRGDERFHVEGNVLVWDRGGVTYRLETPLELEGAQAIASSIR